jgi:hypothetical protein
MKILIIDPLPSLSGDMFLAAGCGLGFDISKVERAIQKMGFSKFKIKLTTRKAGHISARRLKILPEELSYVDLDQAIKKLSSLDMDKKIKEITTTIIKNLISAERKLHADTRTHKGEIYSLDTVIDALGAGMVITELGVERCVYTQIYVPRGLGGGYEFPLLAPATLELLKGYQLTPINIPEEIVTPTGASILSTLCVPDDYIESFQALKVSYSTGGRKFSQGPNLLRLILGEIEFQEDTVQEQIYQLVTSLDDITPEELSYVQEKLFASGALDVQISTYYGKKNRIGFTIVVLCRQEEFKELLSVLFKYTSTSGVRYQKINRFVLSRDVEEFNSSLGRVKIKKFKYLGKEKFKFEYQDLKKIADNKDISISEVKKYLKNKLNT